MRYLSRLVVFALATHLAFAQSVRRLDGTRIRAAEIDQIVTRLMQAAEVPGLGLALFNKGKIAYLRGYGLRDVERRLPFTEDSVVTAASITKSEFATLVMRLVEEGTLALDRPIAEYLAKPLPEYPRYADLADDERYKLITARMLLSHTAGFQNLRGRGKLQIHFTPGSRYAYSGEGIRLLQFVVEEITHKSVTDLMRERVFRPLRMTRSSMLSEVRFEDNYANAYDVWGRSLGHQNRTTPSAAGSMQTTLRDTAAFARFVLNGAGLKPATRAEMLKPQITIHSLRQFPSLNTTVTDRNDAIRLSYGLGWGLFETPYGPALFKEGHDEGFRHYLVLFDKPKTGMLVMTNSSNGESIFRELLATLHRNTFTPIEWESYEGYNDTPHTGVPISVERLADLEGTYSDGELTATVGRSGDRLEVRIGSRVHAFFPETATRFFSRSLRVTLDFAPTSLVIHYTDGDTTLLRQ